jgi:hypothetical protein
MLLTLGLALKPPADGGRCGVQLEEHEGEPVRDRLPPLALEARRGRLGGDESSDVGGREARRVGRVPRGVRLAEGEGEGEDAGWRGVAEAEEALHVAERVQPRARLAIYGRLVVEAEQDTRVKARASRQSASCRP